MRYFIKFSYNGTNYHGWQSQPNAHSVQETLGKALSVVLHSEISYFMEIGKLVTVNIQARSKRPLPEEDFQMAIGY